MIFSDSKPIPSFAGAAAPEGRSSGTNARVLRRRLDALFLGLLGIAVCLLEPHLRLTPLGDLSLLYVLPAVWSGVAAWRLCIAWRRFSAGRTGVDPWRLQLSLIFALGLCPFVSWWSRTDDSTYLAVFAGAALPAAGWFLLELTSWFQRLARWRGWVALGRRARFDEGLVLFCLLAPFTAVYLTGVLTFVFFPGTVSAEVKEVWRLLPVTLKLVMCLAFFEILALIRSVSSALDALQECAVGRPGAARGGENAGSEAE
ncbi:MAG: hypothetical protein GXP31_00195 [Kiritimatiellaeota bacterium]|nr:hypothetical protein [Kiritimatiellota bacterium]